MAKCGCSSACACSVSAGTGVTVTGVGTQANPYVISATGGVLTVNDTPSVDLTLLGSGTAVDPYILSAAAKISAIAGNALTQQADGLAVTCASILACVGATTTVADTNTVNLTQSGGGQITADVIIDPVGGNILTAGPAGLLVSCEAVQDCVGQGFVLGGGLLYNDAAGTYTANISPLAGNSLSIAGDGGLFVPSGGAASITTLDTTCIDLGGNGLGATPLTATPIINAAAGNLLTCTATGLRAALTVGTCGLSGTGAPASPLVANVAVWPFPCPQNAANATEIFCDPVTGQLQGEPRGAMVFDQQFVTTTPAPTAVPAGAGAGTAVGPPLSLTVANPSTCLSAWTFIEIEVDADFDLPAGGTAELMIDGDVMWRDQNRGATTQQDVHTQGTKVVSGGMIAPGASLNVTNELRMRGGAGGATYDRTQLTGRAWVIAI